MKLPKFYFVPTWRSLFFHLDIWKYPRGDLQYRSTRATKSMTRKYFYHGNSYFTLTRKADKHLFNRYLSIRMMYALVSIVACGVEIAYIQLVNATHTHKKWIAP